ncbi:EAL domain-containing protein [Shewanella ulleungensis]|uniref:EAL domain-containing protein n=1 Tax=Shewanella ulleungensis TaxID=2282699 RepID=UPI003D7B8A5C
MYSKDQQTLVINHNLSAINDIGISISMDDFGTGYSSLSYLRSYPFDTLKVDKSFINDITVDPGDLELVGAAIAMGHGLNLNVVAEGIETEEQYQLLNALKCDYGQGYLFSKPLPQAEFEALLEKQESI